MAFKDGFLGGAIIGAIIFLVSVGVFDVENFFLNISVIGNTTVFIIALIALVFTPIIIWNPTSMNTAWKGFLVGFPWAIVLMTTFFQILGNYLNR